MKTKNTHTARISFSLFICGMIVFWGVQVSAEEWTDAQKEL
jgi:hypothetical protein